tara:strand:- start:781 stop:1110 length:330 start_codon:yes stop_codon:yes gene_type:complete
MLAGMSDAPRPGYEIGEETETDAGWAYAITLYSPDGTAATHTLTLSWADHERIAGGTFPPSDTVSAVCGLLAERPAVANTLRERVDTATLRRRIPDFEASVRQRLGGAV